MTRSISRRDFLSASALAGAALPLWPRLAPARGARRSGDAVHPMARPFPLARVRLLPGAALDALEVNRRYLMGLDPDRLLHTFRLTAGLPSDAEPLGGWEAPDNELRGHFTGHYLSACALMAAQTGDSAVRERGTHIVAELARCQQALGTGYLSAFPEELFDRLRDDRRVWAPFYTLHKIMAGLLDTHTLSGDARALDVLRGMATWTERWTQPLGEARMARVLEREYGGMNAVLYDLADVTGEERWSTLAHRFDHERIFAPLAEGRDELEGLHVNTTIPKLIGAARRYEITGERRYHDTAEYFWHTVTERRCYCTGGTSNGESWNAAPGRLAKELSGYTQECCVTYNMQKLTRHVFAWTADPRAADYYERAWYNGILGVEHPKDGNKLYYVPLASGYWKLFGTPLHDFWCCTGSMAEAFSKLGDSIWWHDDDGVWVNLFTPSSVEWPERGVRLVQETRFPEEETVRITVRVERPTRFAMRVRVPYWSAGGRAALDGRALEGFAAPSSYFVVDRTWRDGESLQLTLPMRLHAHPMPDDPTLLAVMYGPLVLAGRLGSEGLGPAVLRAEPTKPRTVPEYKAEPVPAPDIVARASDPATWVRRVSGHPLEFRTVGQARAITLVPLARVFDERYAVYWRVRA